MTELPENPGPFLTAGEKYPDNRGKHKPNTKPETPVCPHGHGPNGVRKEEEVIDPNMLPSPLSPPILKNQSRPSVWNDNGFHC